KLPNCPITQLPNPFHPITHLLNCLCIEQGGSVLHLGASTKARAHDSSFVHKTLAGATNLPFKFFTARAKSAIASPATGVEFRLSEGLRTFFWDLLPTPRRA